MLPYVTQWAKGLRGRREPSRWTPARAAHARSYFILWGGAEGRGAPFRRYTPAFLNADGRRAQVSRGPAGVSRFTRIVGNVGSVVFSQQITVGCKSNSVGVFVSNLSTPAKCSGFSAEAFKGGKGTNLTEVNIGTAPPPAEVANSDFLSCWLLFI